MQKVTSVTQWFEPLNLQSKVKGLNLFSGKKHHFFEEKKSSRFSDWLKINREKMVFLYFSIEK